MLSSFYNSPNNAPREADAGFSRKEALGGYITCPCHLANKSQTQDWDAEISSHSTYGARSLAASVVQEVLARVSGPLSQVALQ